MSALDGGRETGGATIIFPVGQTKYFECVLLRFTAKCLENIELLGVLC